MKLFIRILCALSLVASSTSFGAGKAIALGQKLNNQEAMARFRETMPPLWQPPETPKAPKPDRVQQGKPFKPALKPGTANAVVSTHPSRSPRIVVSKPSAKALKKNPNLKNLAAPEVQAEMKSTRLREFLKKKMEGFTGQMKAPKSERIEDFPRSKNKVAKQKRLKKSLAKTPAIATSNVKLAKALAFDPKKPVQSFWDPSSVEASFTPSSTSVYVGESVYFYNDSEAFGEDYDGYENYIVEYYWTFGDGWTSDEREPSHYYSSAGSKYVTLTVVDVDGNEDWTYDYVNVSNKPVYYSAVYAAFDASSTLVTVDEDIYFDNNSYATGQDDEGYYNEIATTKWTFGDGSGNYYDFNKYHSFDYPGVYTVYLYVTDTAGNSAYTSKTITVTAKAYPVADFTLSPTTAYVGDDVFFDSYSYVSSPSGYTSDYITRLEWSFGDGGTRTSYNRLDSFKRQYTTAGKWTVRLYAYDNNGNYSTYSKEVTILPKVVVNYPWGVTQNAPTGPKENRTMSAQIQIATLDKNLVGSVFVIAILRDGSWFYKRAGVNEWYYYASPLIAPGSYYSGALPASLPLNLLTNINIPELRRAAGVDINGAYIYTGYGIGASAQAAWSEIIGAVRYGVAGIVVE